MQCLILTGGPRTRIQGHDPMEPEAGRRVAGRPFADWRLRRLTSEGVSSTDFSADYSADRTGVLIHAFVGSGIRWELSMTYVTEAGELPGSASLCRSTADQGLLSQRFFDVGPPTGLRVLDDHRRGQAVR